MKTEAWLLNADGTLTPCIAARRCVWPGTAVVTFADGTTATTSVLNVLAGDNVDERYFTRQVSR